MARINFTFLLTGSRSVGFDTAEFKDQTPAQAADAIRRTLGEIDREASFFEEDIIAAADVLVGSNGKTD